MRTFIGPNGARFTVAEPLPAWLERRLAAGEVTEEGAPAVRGDDLDDLSRAELNERAEMAGVTDPAGLPNKGAVIEAIREASGWVAAAEDEEE